MKVLSCAQPRIDVSIDCSKPQLTDQSYAKACDINNIMLQYQKTKMFPNFPIKEALYIDNTEIPPFLEAHRLVNEARSLFYDLPAQIRKLMDNDPSQLEMFIADPSNQYILEKHGILIPKQQPTQEPAKKEEPSKEVPKS